MNFFDTLKEKNITRQRFPSCVFIPKSTWKHVIRIRMGQAIDFRNLTIIHNKSNDLRCKSGNWFLYNDYTEISYTDVYPSSIFCISFYPFNPRLE